MKYPRDSKVCEPPMSLRDADFGLPLLYHCIVLHPSFMSVESTISTTNDQTMVPYLVHPPLYDYGSRGPYPIGLMILD